MSFPESLRDRAEAVMDDVGVVFSGNLVSDVTAAAEKLGVSYTTMGATVEACEEAQFERAGRWLEERRKERVERIRKRPKKERRRCNPIVAAFFESVNNPQADESHDEDWRTAAPIPLRPFLTKAEREARETVAARVRKRRRS